MATHTKVSLLSLALLGLLGCASSENSPGGGGDGDSGGDGDTSEPGDVFIESIETDKGATIEDGNMIDDFEDGDDVPLDEDDRLGSWYTFSDEESDDGEISPKVGSTFKPDPEGFDGSKGAALVKGKGFKSYAGFGVDFNNDGEGGEKRGTYDASKFKGITFVAKGNGAPVRLGFSIPSTVGDDSEGGECKPAAMCYDTHGVDFTPEKDWVKYDIPFAKIKQEGHGVSGGEFKPEELLGLTFSFVPSDKEFELAIDNLGFYE